MANYQLLLLEDVESLGRKGAIVTTKPGYARNCLLPKGCAVVATKNALRMQQRLLEERKKQAEVDYQESETLAKRLETVQIKTEVKVDRDGKMYGSVSAVDIVDLLNEHMQIKILKKDVLLKQPLKKLGSHSVPVKLKEGVEGRFTLIIEPDEAIVLPAAEVSATETTEV